MNIEQIQKDHPSICYDCQYSRRPASDTNTKKGYVGCCLRVIGKRGKDAIDTFDHDVIDIAKEIGEGWVDLRSTVFREKGSGFITNFQLITLEVQKCRMYEKKA